MKKREVVIGELYRVSHRGKTTIVRLTRERRGGKAGWEGLDIATQRPVTVAAASRIQTRCTRQGKPLPAAERPPKADRKAAVAETVDAVEKGDLTKGITVPAGDRGMTTAIKRKHKAGGAPPGDWPGSIDRDTPIGRQFLFSGAKGMPDPRTQAMAPAPYAFTLRYYGPGDLKAKKPKWIILQGVDGSRLHVTLAHWAAVYAPVCQEIRDGEPSPIKVDRFLQDPPQKAVPIGKIDLDVANHRHGVDESNVADLVASIGRHGLIHPIAVCSRKARYVLIAGHRRLVAHQVLGRKTIVARVWSGLSDLEISCLQAVENLQHKHLSPVEEAHAFAALRDGGESLELIGARVDRAASYVHNRLELLRLSPAVAELVDTGRLPVAHGRLLARVGDAATQASLAADAVGAGMRQGCPIKFGEGDFVMPLSGLRKMMTWRLQSLGSCHWPMDGRYAGRRACVGCPSNSATQPGLFEDMTLPGSSPKGCCTDKRCFQTKTKAWAKDPVKLARDAAREKARKAKADGPAKRAAGPARTSGPPRFPHNAADHHQLAVVRHLAKVRKAVGGHIERVIWDEHGGQAFDDGEIRDVIVELLFAFGGHVWVPNMGANRRKFLKALEGKARLTFRPADRLAQLYRMATEVHVHLTAFYRELKETPLALLACLERIAQRWKVDVPPRPVLKDYDANGKRPAEKKAAKKKAAKKKVPKRPPTALDAAGSLNWRCTGQTNKRAELPERPRKKRAARNATGKKKQA